MSSQQPSSVICLPEEEEEKNQIKTRIVIKPIKRYAYMLCVCFEIFSRTTNYDWGELNGAV